MGIWYIFQTFEELDSVEDKKGYTQEVRDLLEESTGEHNNCSRIEIVVFIPIILYTIA